jgi:hypothetical protein
VQEAEQRLAKVGDTDKQAKIKAEQDLKTAKARLQAVSPF